MSRWSKENAQQQGGKPLPGRVWPRQEVPPAYARTAISLMGLIILADGPDHPR